MGNEERLSMPSPLVSAVVLNYKTPQEAVRCVRALRTQTIADKLEIIVVDNHSENDSIGVLRVRLRDEPNVIILETPCNLGYGQGNMIGVRRASGTYLFIINPDNELEPRGLEQMIAAMEADPSIGIIAPLLVHPDGTVRDSARRFPTPADILIKRTPLRSLFPERVRHYLRADEAIPAAPRDVDWVAGACFLTRRDLFSQLGGFDPRFFLFFEDTDLCRRMWKAGKRVVHLPSVRATDRKIRLSEGGFLTLFTNWTAREHVKSALRYFTKWGTKWRNDALTARSASPTL
jgi:hypothetical protein